MQNTLVIFILIASAVYAGWWIAGVVRHASDPCHGCEGCPLQEAKRKTKHKKPDCWHKK